MSDVQASDAGRALANLRWRGRGIDVALTTIRERAAEITDEQRAELRTIAGKQQEAEDS